MHESGLALAIADTLQTEHAAGAHVRVLVSGGHSDPDDFDASLRFHLALAAPGLDTDAIDIVHVSTDRLCAGCEQVFVASKPDARCPHCGASGLPIPTPERVEIELVRPGDTDP